MISEQDKRRIAAALPLADCSRCPHAPICAPMPDIKTLPVLGKKVTLVEEFLETDLLVLTGMEGTRSGGFVRELDDRLGGALSKAKKEAGFRGVLGSHVLIDLAKQGVSPARPRYILLVGLGDYKTFTLPIICGLMRLALEKAVELGVERLTLPVIPNRLSQHTINLIGTGSIIHCRVEERFMLHGSIGNLKEVNLLCTPQAKKHLDEGLSCQTPRCPICPDPRIDTAEEHKA